MLSRVTARSRCRVGLFGLTAAPIGVSTGTLVAIVTCVRHTGQLFDDLVEATSALEHVLQYPLWPQGNRTWSPMFSKQITHE